MLKIIKEGRRRRYIGFILEDDDLEISKTEMINSIRSYCNEIFNIGCKSKGFFLVRFSNNKGILRCKHTEKDNAIKLLNSIKKIGNKDIKIKTIGTSGTIKSLIKKHFDKK